MECAADDVARDIEHRANQANLFKVYLGIAGAVLLLSLGSTVTFVVALVLAATAGVFVHRWDRQRRTSRVFYDVDREEIVARFALANATGEALGSASSLWQVHGSTATGDAKYHAGAGTLVERTSTRCIPGALPGVELNIEPWSVPGGPQALLFLPDRLIVKRNGHVGSIPYASLSATHQRVPFVEEGPVPPDSEVVDTTWRYANKAGGPDLRFNDNYSIPVVAYGELTLRSPNGFTSVLQASHPESTRRAAMALQALARLGQTSSPEPVREPSPRPAPVIPQRTSQVKAAVRRAHPKRREFRGADDVITVAGRSISRPLTYVAPTAHGIDASTIVTTLPVGRGALALPMGYWPSYAAADPDQRARYLDWMVDGRTDPEIPIGYVFIFFYGLEWRVLYEGADADVAVAEVRALYDRYASHSGSFRSYAASFLGFIAASRLATLSQAQLEESIGHLIGESPTATAALLAWHLEHAQPLPARHAAAIASSLDGAKQGVVVKRSADELADLFGARYRDRFGEGIPLKAAKRPTSLHYHPASATILQLQQQHRVTLPNVLGLVRPFKPLVEMWNACVDDLRKSSTIKGKTGGELTSQAWAALPPELRDQYEHPNRDRWETAIAAAPRIDGLHRVSLSELSELAELDVSTKLTAAQLRKLTEAAADVGYAMEPDGRAQRKARPATDHALLWPSRDVSCPDPELYGPVFTLLALAMTIALADGVVHQEETRVVLSTISDMFALDERFRKRLAALHHLLTHEPIRTAPLTKRLRDTRSHAELLKLGRLLVAVAAADGVIADPEHNALERLYKALGLSSVELSATIAAAGAHRSSDEPVVVRTAEPARAGEAIPRPPDDTTALDHDAIAAILADTREVAAMLADVLDEDDDDEATSEPAAPVPAPAVSPEITTLAGTLDVRYHGALAELLAKPTWSRDEVRALAGRHHLMPGAIAETINAWSDETYGDFLIDDNEHWRVHTELVKGARS